MSKAKALSASVAAPSAILAAAATVAFWGALCLRGLLSNLALLLISP